MGLLRIVAEAGALLNSHGEVRANHGLEIAKAANDGAIVPGVGVALRIGVTVEEVAIVGGRVVKFDVGCGGVKADHGQDPLNHVGLGKGDGSI